MLHGDKVAETRLSDFLMPAPVQDARDLNIESAYEYGSCVGFWHLMRVLGCRQWNCRPANRPGKAISAAPPMHKKLRDREMELARHAEHGYERFVSRWQRRGNAQQHTGAASEERH